MSARAQQRIRVKIIHELEVESNVIVASDVSEDVLAAAVVFGDGMPDRMIALMLLRLRARWDAESVDSSIEVEVIG